MDNSYFFYSNTGEKIRIERFHICTWEFRNNTCFVEIGLEVTAESVTNKNTLQLELYIPWFEKGCTSEDFYEKLKEPHNSRFIFNDSIKSSVFFDGGRNLNGVIHEFSEKNKLCILPVTRTEDYENRRITITIDLTLYNSYQHPTGIDKPNIYTRFAVIPQKAISTQKKGITKSTILYDIKLNQRRNIPDNLSQEFIQKELCEITTCFCFNIIPNSYDLSFFDSSSLKNVRTLEYGSFSRYIGDNRVKEDDLIVVFNKKEKLDSYAFFSIYTKEHIGTDQFALALLISLIAGVLLFIPSYRISLPPDSKKLSFWEQMPGMFWFVIILVLGTISFIIWPRITILKRRKRK